MRKSPTDPAPKWTKHPVARLFDVIGGLLILLPIGVLAWSLCAPEDQSDGWIMLGLAILWKTALPALICWLVAWIINVSSRRRWVENQRMIAMMQMHNSRR